MLGPRSYLQLLLPRFGISLYYFLKYGAKVSTRAEVDLTANLRFGKNCVVSSFTKIKALDGPLKIGESGGFATGCFVSSFTCGIEIGDNFICGPNVSIVESNYITEKVSVPFRDQGYASRGIKIGNNVWVGAGAVILDGSVIGDNTIVVANSLVNRRHPPNVMLQGNPAKVIFTRT